MGNRNDKSTIADKKYVSMARVYPISTPKAREEDVFLGERYLNYGR